jgi:hypothetical protein
MKPAANIFRSTLSEPSVPLYRFVGSLLFISGSVMIWLSYEYQSWIGGATGILFFIGGASLLLIREGIEINFKDRTYRNYSSVVNILIGQWKALPALDYITIYNEKLGMNSHVASLHYTLEEQKLKIALVYGNKQQIAVGRFHTKEKAFDVGKLLAIKLQSKLLDYTQKEPVWLIE